MELNRWREEEDKETSKVIDRFNERHDTFIDRLFLNPDKKNEMLEKEINEERLKFRAKQLDFLEKKLEEERKRVDNVCIDLEKRLNQYFKEVKGYVEKEHIVNVEDMDYKDYKTNRILDEKHIIIEPLFLTLFQEKIFKDR